MKIKNTTGEEVNPLELVSGEDYRIYIDVENKGNFTENVSFFGTIDGLINFSHNPVSNLLPGDKKEKYKTVNFALPEGTYNLSVFGEIANDSEPENNYVSTLVSVFEINCTDDSECSGYVEGQPYCMGNKVYREDIMPVCINPGTIDSYCDVETQMVFLEDCGTNYSESWQESYCKQGDVYHNRTVYSLGCSSGSCFNLSYFEEELVETCEGYCENGECVEINCMTNEDCDDGNKYTIDTCVNPGTVESYCVNQEINCLNDWDCGITGFIGEEYCFNNDVYKLYQTAVCVNPGSVDSYCNVEVFPNLIQECDDGDDYTLSLIHI